MIPTRTVREQVTDLIRAEVLNGAFPAGHALREDQLAKAYGVSRGPIRDAFLQLAQEGLLAYQANRGVTVRHPPGPEHCVLIVSLRQQIECFVVRRGLDKSVNGALDTVAAALDELKTACVGGKAAAVARADMAFHQEILLACGGKDFLPIWKWLCSQMMFRYERLDDYQQVYEEHVRIFQALTKGKKPSLIAALKANIR